MIDSERRWKKTGLKTIKDYLNHIGYNVQSPRETIRQDFSLGLIDNGEVWLDAIEHRNESSHEYDESILNKTVEFILTQFYDVAYILLTRFNKLLTNK